MSNPFAPYAQICKWDLEVTFEGEDCTYYVVKGHPDYFLAQDEADPVFPRYYVVNTGFTRVSEKKWNPRYAVEALENLIS